MYHYQFTARVDPDVSTRDMAIVNATERLHKAVDDPEATIGDITTYNTDDDGVPVSVLLNVEMETCLSNSISDECDDLHEEFSNVEQVDEMGMLERPA